MENIAYPRIKNAVLLCLLLIGIQLAAGFILGIIFGLLSLSTESLIDGISTIIISLLSFGVVILIGFIKSKQKFNEVFKFNNVSLGYWIATIIFMFGFVILLSEIDNIFNYFLPVPKFLQDIFEAMMVKQTFIIAIIQVGIVPAITEEMFFRGIVLNGFKRNYSDKKAILISALLFGIIHLNPWQFVTAFIIGIIMAWIYIKTKSIILCIYIHLFNNIIGVIALKYKEILSIKGFNTAYSEQTFHPIWLDLVGIAITVTGIFFMIRAIKKAKTIA
jgi:membrane protease YdiL (CAAX protease family)